MHQPELASIGSLDSDEGEEPQGNPEELEEEACLPGRAEAIAEALQALDVFTPRRSNPGLDNTITEREAPLDIALQYDISDPVFVLGAVPTQLAADASLLPSPVRKGADRAPIFDCNSLDIAALLSDATDMAAI